MSAKSRAKEKTDQAKGQSAILHAAERKGVILIAIASHGRTGLPQVFYGSVVAKDSTGYGWLST